jgi:hypothetical protein
VSARLNFVKGPRQTIKFVGFRRSWPLVTSEGIPCRHLFGQISQFCSYQDTESSGRLVKTPRSPKDAMNLPAN